MKKLKNFIDNLQSDKKSHVVFGLVINPLIIIGFLMSGNLIGLNNIIWFGYLGVIVSCLFHYYIEFWQRKTGKGKFELWDAFAGSYSAFIIGLIFFIIHILQ